MSSPTANMRPFTVPQAVALPKGLPNSNPTHSLTVLGILSCVRRRWKQAVVLGAILGACAAVFVWLFLPPARPYAYTKLYFPTKPAGAVDHPDPPVNQSTQKELITSRIVLRAVVEDPATAKLACVSEKNDPISWLIRDLTVDFPIGSEIMKLSLADERADEAKQIIDKVAEVYLAKIGNESLENRKKHMLKLKEMLEGAKKELAKDFPNSRGASDAPSENPEINAQRQQIINNQIISAESDLTKIKSQIAALKPEVDRLSARMAKMPLELTTAEFEPLFAQNPNANQLRRLRDDLQAEYVLKSSGLGEENPTMKSLKGRIDQVDVRLQSMRKELHSTIALSFQEKLTDDLRKMRDELTRYGFDQQAKEADIAAKQAEFKKLKSDTNIAGRLKPGEDAKKKLVEELESKFLKYEAEITAPVAVRQLEEEAVIVRPNDASRRMKMSMVAAVGLFGFTFIALAFLEFRAHRVTSAVEVAQSLGLRLMGTVPAPPKNSKQGITDREWESALNEAVDSTRTIFLHSATIHNLRRVMVTSAMGGEGKSSLSARLATSLARSGRKVLLIDADLRSPSLQDHFEVPNGPGVCDILRGEARVSDCLRTTADGKMAIILGGQCDRQALQALAQDGFKRLLAEVDTLGFDFILVDSCPVLPVADALLVAPHVDGVLFSLMIDVSQVDRVNAACQKLASIDVPLLGAVVNGTRGETYGYGPETLVASTV